MTAYWKDFRGDDPDLWEHEWNKHGTCISTLETKCYMDYYPQQEVVDYFDKTVEIFQKLPSYQVCSWISQKGGKVKVIVLANILIRPSPMPALYPLIRRRTLLMTSRKC